MERWENTSLWNIGYWIFGVPITRLLTIRGYVAEHRLRMEEYLGSLSNTRRGQFTTLISTRKTTVLETLCCLPINAEHSRYELWGNKRR